MPETEMLRHVIHLKTGEQPYWVFGNETTAEAKTVIAVHGLRGTHQGLRRIGEEIGPDYRVIIPDLPGFGESPDLPGGNTVENYADWLVDFVASLNLANAPVLGHSFGTIIVAAAAARLTASRLILVNPIAANNRTAGPHPHATRAVSWLYRVAGLLPAGAGRWILTNRLHVGGMNASTITTTDAEVAEWIKGQHAAYYNKFDSVAGVVTAFEESASKSVSDFAPGIWQETLLVAAEHDSLSTPQATLDLASDVANSTLVVISGVGHLIHYERPTEAAEIIKEFLGR